ncbi:hypothetical protein DUI87_25389 [Hirundo rustica rustica]|uniref:LIM zinc-binding domain-containing protein n=1 Tax=Hirundo rustica rustica TaxID=333673 RepID=A0A3M0J9R3_HIRRU|nr:hypothetical protein DUI87_25389 [Hirundo rustica rustica]
MLLCCPCSDFDALNEEDVVRNNQLAFDVAEQEFGIPPVTTGKELGSAGEPDKLSMVLYLSKFYELFRGTPLRAVDAAEKQNGENNDLGLPKSSNFIFNNYINLTLPRKRVPKTEGKTEENETNKRRRKGLFGVFEQTSGLPSQGTNSGKEQSDGREGMNQNRVKSMATQLLAKFEENTSNTILRRQFCMFVREMLSSEMARVKAEEQSKWLTFFYFNSENFALLLILNDLLLDDMTGMLKKASHYKANLDAVGLTTVGKVSRAIGAVAEVLVNLYVNDHRPKPQLELGSLRKEFPKSIGGSDTCYFCKKRVYVMERLSAEGHFFHRECFKCEICSTTLRLGIYAFDVEEGKFYCKPHFTHCKISTKHRKRRATIQIHGKEAIDAWKKVEAKPTEITTESTLSTASSPEDRSPGCCLPVADEPTSPKKAKSVPEQHEMERWFSPPSPEWAIVRVIPEEEMAEHNLLAVRVMVTSDASSSELESDFNGDSSNSEVSEGQTWLLEPRACSSPIQRWASLIRSPAVPEESSKTSKVADDFTSDKVNANRKVKVVYFAGFPLLSSKKPGLHGKDSSASCQSGAAEEHSQTQLASYKRTTEIPRGPFKPCSPVFQRKGKAREVSEDTHCYVPHSPFQSSTTGPSLTPLGNGTLAADFHEPEDPDRDTGTHSAWDWKEKTWKYNSEPGHFNRKTKTLSSLDLKEKDGKNTRHPGEKLEQELKEAKQRLGLRNKQQPLNGSNRTDSGGSSPGHGNNGALEKKDAGWRKERSGCPGPLLLVDGAPPTPSVDTKDALRIADVVSREHAAGQPKSPLRLIANVIKRSIWEPLTSAPEGIKQDSDSKVKASSEQAFFSFPSTPGYSLSQRNRNNNNTQSQDTKVREWAGKYVGDESAYSNLSRPSVGSEGISLRDYREEVSFTPYRLSKTTHIPQKPACTRMEEVPGLLEKFTFEDSPLGAPMDEICIRKKKSTLLSSAEPKSSFKDSLDDSAQKGSLFNRMRSKACEREQNSLVSSLPIIKDHSPEGLFSPFTGYEHLPVRRQATECSTSSSDEEFESKPSLTHKAKRAIRKRRKLEKETKQLIKQEELKRLHKAQAVQRQLEELEERQRALEIFGVKLERELRGEADSGTKDENQMLHEWFELVMEKNKLMRYESELLIIAQELELEDHQSRLEQKLREKMAIDDSLKDEMDLNEEDEIFTEMMKVVEERDRLQCTAKLCIVEYRALQIWSSGFVAFQQWESQTDQDTVLPRAEKSISKTGPSTIVPCSMTLGLIDLELSLLDFAWTVRFGMV